MYYLQVATSIPTVKERHPIKLMEIKDKVMEQPCLEISIPSLTRMSVGILICLSAF